LGKNQIFIVLLCSLFFYMSCFTGCGVKNPPLPPVEELPNAVTDLEETVMGSVVVLKWSSPDKKDDAVIERFGIFRSTSRLEEYCPECPITFKKIADIHSGADLWQGEVNKNISYSEELETGNRYSYKVVGYTWDNVASADSNLVSFSF
jgi:hypothetical protein